MLLLSPVRELLLLPTLLPDPVVDADPLVPTSLQDCGLDPMVSSRLLDAVPVDDHEHWDR